MASSAILAVQTGRWEGLRTSIELFEASMKADTDPTTRHATGQLMLQALRLFTEEMFTFFQEGFAEGQGAEASSSCPAT